MQLLEQYFETLFSHKDVLQTWRQKAWERFLEIGLLQWKSGEYTSRSFPPLAVDPAERKHAEQDFSSLILIDGFFVRACVPEPLVFLPLEKAMQKYGIFLQTYLTRSLQEETDPFAALNISFHGRGLFCYIPPDTAIKKPIAVQHILTDNHFVNAFIMVVVGRNSSVRFTCQSEQEKTRFFVNQRIDVLVEEGASCTFVDAQKWSAEGVCFQTLRSTVKQQGSLHYTSLASGGKMLRSSLHAKLLGEHGSALLQGLARRKDSSFMDTLVQVEHGARACTSKQHFKVILEESSRCDFAGKIVVQSLAQKTDASQLHNALLLSDQASVCTKPDLEIFTDDVKATHGATVAQLSEEELFYLASRGICREEAQQMLIAGFCKEIYDTIGM